MKSLTLVGLFGAALAGQASECRAGDETCVAAAGNDAEDMKVTLLQVRNQRKGSVDTDGSEAIEGVESDDPVECDEDPEAEQYADPVPSTGIQHAYAMGPDDTWTDFGEDEEVADEDQIPHPKERQWSYSTANCAAYGCGNYKHGRNCQCNAICKKYDSCCSDYSELCDHSAHATPAPTPAETAVPMPADPSAQAGSVDGVFGHPSPTIAYPKYEGYTLMLAEEFDTPIDLDHDPIWTWSDGGLREGQVRFVKEQIKFNGGKMTITVSNQRPFPKMQSCSMASKEHIPYKPLVSGELRTRHNMFRYGIYEVRMKAPEVQPGKPHVNGNFIATMFVYRDANAHHWREIDFELTGDAPNSLTTNLLYADGTKNWKAYLQDSRRPNLGPVNIRKDFHTYMFKWTPQGVIWHFDGKVIRKGSRLKVPDRSCKIMLNTWIFTGGGFGGSAIHNNRYPMVTTYEYFRFYKWNEESTYPCKGMKTDCLTEDDMYLSTNNPCDGIPQKGHLGGLCKAVCHK